MEDYRSISTADTSTAGVHTDDSRSVSGASTITISPGPADFTPHRSQAHFHYPIPSMEDYQSISTADTSTAVVHTDDSRSVSRASTITAYTISPGPTDFAPQLSQAPDFRVPTREAPQVGLSKRPPQQNVVWERDEKVSNCRDCNCRFGFLNRRVSLSIGSY